MPADARLLMLVSGGASALAEALPEGMVLEELQAKSDEWIRNGLNIAQINANRKKLSQIKGGKLLQQFKGAAVTVLAISDVEGDSIETIGSGIGSARLCPLPAQTRIIASNAIAREAAVATADALGLPLRINRESLYADVFELAPEIAAELSQGEPGVYFWGGEPTIMLPENPGQGGRNQSLALALAQEIRGHENITILVAGTDGTDGPTDAAGGMVDGFTADDPTQLQSALERADAGPYLARRDALFTTGPTRTNVMDLVIAIVG
jgi:hydroxypyruvate reductase